MKSKFLILFHHNKKAGEKWNCFRFLFQKKNGTAFIAPPLRFLFVNVPFENAPGLAARLHVEGFQIVSASGTLFPSGPNQAAFLILITASIATDAPRTAFEKEMEAKQKSGLVIPGRPGGM